MRDCALVCHTASPFVLSGIRDPQKELVDPALKGTRNVLNNANRSESVRRVVLTSSVSIHGDAAGIRETQSGVFTEAHWNTTSSLDHQPYSYSRVEAEKLAWAMREIQDRWELVVVNPGLVLGPSLTRASISGSLRTFRDLVGGGMRMDAPELSFGVVDVRDVAEGHYRASVTDAAREPEVRVSKYRLSDPVRQPSRPREAGVSFRPLEETLVEHVRQMLEEGLV